MATTAAPSMIRPLFSTPYITPAEYKQAPTGVDVTNLVKGNQSASDAELANVIARSCSLIDTYFCGQTLAATVDPDAGYQWVDRDGFIHVHPRQTPIIEVTAFSYGSTPNDLIALSDFSAVAVETSMFHVPLTGGYSSSAGPLQFGMPRPGTRAWCQWTVVSGWPVTTLAATAAAGATSITVTDATGVLAGITPLGIYDGGQSESVTVASSYVAGSATLPLTAPLRFPHNQTGVSVSGLPPAVKQAAILITTALIKTRGAAAIVAPAAGQYRSRVQSAQPGGVDSEEFYIAEDLLLPFRRVR